MAIRESNMGTRNFQFRLREVIEAFFLPAKRYIHEHQQNGQGIPFEKLDFVQTMLRYGEMRVRLLDDYITGEIGTIWIETDSGCGDYHSSPEDMFYGLKVLPAGVRPDGEAVKKAD